MASSRLFLVLDQGGHATRAMVFDYEGTIHSQHTVPVATTEPAPLHVEHDAHNVLASVHQAIAGAVSALPTPLTAKNIIAAGLATQRSSIVCWSRRTTTPLTPILSWQDRRAHEWMAQWQSQLNRVREITGLVPSAHYGASKIRWCLDHSDAVTLKRLQHDLICGPLASFLIAALTVEHANYCDPANASRTLLFNVEQQSWDVSLLRDFGIPAHVLPLTVPTRYRYGTLLVDGARIPLKIVTGDQSAVVFQNGTPAAQTLYINVGTGAFLQRVSTDLPRAPDGLLRSVVYAERGQTTYAIEGTVNGAGSALTWLSQQDAHPDWVIHAPQWLESGPGEVLFLNTVGGLGSPFWITDRPPLFIGKGNTQQRFVAVVESILFLIFSNIEVMRGAKIQLDNIVISGGIAALEAVCQRLADLTQIPVSRPENLEATARGVAFLLTPRTEEWKTAARVFTPKNNLNLITRYHHWRTALEDYIAGQTQ